jgi:proline iminopeptidase
MVDVNGVRLFTRRVGTGPPVVVLHGGPGAHHDYLLPQYDLLARGRTLYYYDQRGGGRSPVARDTTTGWREHVADLDALRIHWGLEALTLLGYSWGGLLALLYTLVHRDRTKRLALVCPAPIAARWGDELQRRLEARLADPAIRRARAELNAGGLRTADPERYRRLAFALSVAGYFHDPARAQDLTPFRVTQRTRDAVWTSLGQYDLQDEVRAAFTGGPACPALVVAGVYDPMPLDAARELAAIIHAQLVLLPTGHAPHVEDTNTFIEALDGFLPNAT